MLMMHYVTAPAPARPHHASSVFDVAHEHAAAVPVRYHSKHGTGAGKPHRRPSEQRLGTRRGEPRTESDYSFEYPPEPRSRQAENEKPLSAPAPEHLERREDDAKAEQNGGVHVSEVQRSRPAGDSDDDGAVAHSLFDIGLDVAGDTDDEQNEDMEEAPAEVSSVHLRRDDDGDDDNVVSEAASQAHDDDGVVMSNDNDDLKPQAAALSADAKVDDVTPVADVYFWGEDTLRTCVLCTFLLVARSEPIVTFFA